MREGIRPIPTDSVTTVEVITTLNYLVELIEDGEPTSEEIVELLRDYLGERVGMLRFRTATTTREEA